MFGGLHGVYGGLHGLGSLLEMKQNRPMVSVFCIFGRLKCHWVFTSVAGVHPRLIVLLSDLLKYSGWCFHLLFTF